MTFFIFFATFFAVLIVPPAFTSTDDADQRPPSSPLPQVQQLLAEEPAKRTPTPYPGREPQQPPASSAEGPRANSSLTFSGEGRSAFSQVSGRTTQPNNDGEVKEAPGTQRVTTAPQQTDSSFEWSFTIPLSLQRAYNHFAALYNAFSERAADTMIWLIDHLDPIN